MPVAVLTFRAKGSRPDARDRLENAAESLLASLWKNGQIEGEHVAGWDGNAWSAWCRVPAADFLENRHWTPWVADAMAAVGTPPTVRIVGDDRPVRSPSWKGGKALLLYAHWTSRTSPVVRDWSKVTVPVYALPLEPGEREGIQFWANEYRRTVRAWIDSGSLEAVAHRELTDPSRRLLAEGRNIARRIEGATALPTYLFLTRYGAGDANGRCPSCGRGWNRRLRCDPCRLASYLPPMRITEK